MGDPEQRLIIRVLSYFLVFFSLKSFEINLLNQSAYGVFSKLPSAHIIEKNLIIPARPNLSLSLRKNDILHSYDGRCLPYSLLQGCLFSDQLRS